MLKRQIAEIEPVAVDQDPEVLIKEWKLGWDQKMPHCSARYKNRYWTELFSIDERILLPLLVAKMKEDPNENYPMILLYDEKVMSYPVRGRRLLCIRATDHTRLDGDRDRANLLVKLWDSGATFVCKTCCRYCCLHESYPPNSTDGECMYCFYRSM